MYNKNTEAETPAFHNENPQTEYENTHNQQPNKKSPYQQLAYALRQCREGNFTIPLSSEAINDPEWQAVVNEYTKLTSTLDRQVDEQVDVLTALAGGDFSKTVKGEAQGKFLELKEGLNKNVLQYNEYMHELKRAIREVSTNGHLETQVGLPQAEGAWREFIEMYNGMIQQFATQIEDFSRISAALSSGDFSTLVTVDAKGDFLQLKEVINKNVQRFHTFTKEITRLSKEMSTEGILTSRAHVPEAQGMWREVVEHLNSMAAALDEQISEFGEVSTAVAQGDLSKSVEVHAKGKFLTLKTMMNDKVARLRILTDEFTRVTDEIADTGTLQKEVEVPGAQGVWLSLTNSINQMGNRLNMQFSQISNIAASISRGDLSKRVEIDAKGEFLKLKDALNEMIDTLNTVTSQVVGLSDDAGKKGILSRRVASSQFDGTWHQIVEAINTLLQTVNDPLQEIIQLASALSEGDLSQRASTNRVGDFLQLATSLNQALDDLGGFIQLSTGSSDKINNSAAQLADASQQINMVLVQLATTTQNISESAKLQSKKLENSTQLVAGLSTSIQQGSEIAQSTAEMAQQASKLAEKGAESGTLASKQLRMIDDFVKSNTTIVKELDQKAKEIKSILGATKDIADQTNLLALNAAIEAAHAGDAGRGFAVVADEIRKLAEGAKVSAVKIEEVVLSISDSSTEVVSAMEQGTKQVAESITMINEALTALEKLSTSFQEVTGKAQEISGATETQSKGALEMAKSIEEIATSGEETATGASQIALSVQQQTATMQQVASSAQDLSKLSDDLKEFLNRFIITNINSHHKKGEEEKK